jgi:hypothetical protein
MDGAISTFYGGGEGKFLGGSVRADAAGLEGVFGGGIAEGAGSLGGVQEYERAGEKRRGYRNGFYVRDFVTRLGTLRLRVARSRERSFRPPGLERFERRAAEVMLLIREAFLRGISTRQGAYAAMVKRLEKDLPELLTFFDFPQTLWRQLRTTNVIERCFVIYAIFNGYNEQHQWRNRTLAFLHKQLDITFYTSSLTSPDSWVSLDSIDKYGEYLWCTQSALRCSFARPIPATITYLRLVENYRHDGKVRQRVVAHLGRKDLLARHLDALVRLLQNDQPSPRWARLDQLSTPQAWTWEGRCGRLAICGTSWDWVRS